MAKWYGKIGFTVTEEIEPGMWVNNELVTREYFGDVISNQWIRQNSGEVNDNIKISNQISIVADPYAIENFYKMRYAEFNGTKWKVTDVEVQYPRLLLTLGGVWNGNKGTTSE